MKNSLICNIIFAITLFSFNACNAQYTDVSPYIHTKPNYSVTPNNAVDLTEYLPKNFVKNASVDYTTYIQKGVDENKVIKFPDFPVLVNTKGIKLQSNSKVYFQPNSKLQIIPNDKSVYQILRLIRINNVEVYNPNVEGDKYTHLNTDGQWGMGISIQGATSIKIYSPQSARCWGDGIYIGNSGELKSKNIKIYNAIIDDNRRNGISVVSVDGLLIDAPVIANTNLQNPQCGIDIEPNKNSDVLKNIVINSPITLNNNNCGIMLSTGSIMGENKKEIDILIKNHHDIGSRYAVGHAITRHYKRLRGETICGKIEFLNPVWEKNIVKPFRFFDYQDHSVITKFTNVKILDEKNKMKNIKKELPRHKKIKIYK